MRIATYRHLNQRHVGQVSADGQHVTAFQVSAEVAEHGALRLIESLMAGGTLPALATTAVPVKDVHLEAPLPPLRDRLLRLHPL